MNNHSTRRTAVRIIIIVLCAVNIGFLVLHPDAGGSVRNALGGKSQARSAASESTSALSENDSGTQSGSGEASITLSDDFPDLTQDDLDDVVPVLKKAGAISASDGSGNDITDNVQAVTSADASRPGHFTIDFSVTAGDGQTASAEKDVTVDLTKPVIELSQYQVTVNKDDSFNALDYLKDVLDTDGTDLSRSVHVDDPVDTSTPETYRVTYSVSSRQDDSEASKTLEVTVK